MRLPQKFLEEEMMKASTRANSVRHSIRDSAIRRWVPHALLTTFLLCGGAAAAYAFRFTQPYEEPTGERRPATLRDGPRGSAAAQRVLHRGRPIE